MLPRAIETAARLAPGLPEGLTPTPDCELCELHPGEADGLTWFEFLERFGAPDWDDDPLIPLAPGAESWTGFYERCAAAFEPFAIATRVSGPAGGRTAGSWRTR